MSSAGKGVRGASSGSKGCCHGFASFYWKSKMHFAELLTYFRFFFPCASSASMESYNPGFVGALLLRTGGLSRFLDLFANSAKSSSAIFR